VRKRLPLLFIAAVARRAGRRLDACVESQWLWKGRRVHLFDWSSVAMPDTPENRKEYPRAYKQKPGTRLAVARIAAVASLSTIGWRLCRPRHGCCAPSAALSR
jgi:hypothetical protein